MDYLWSRQLDISNFGAADRKILPVELICRVLGLLVSLLEFNRFEILLEEQEEGRVGLQKNFQKFSDYWRAFLRGQTGVGGGGIVDEDNESDYSLLVAQYARLIYIYGSSGKGVMASGAERSSDGSYEGSDSVSESEDVFPGVAGE
nr:hypothetical protein [Tanacetum cinerariifolium]